MVVDPPDTLPPVAKTKRVSPAVLTAFARVLKKWVDDEHKGNQTHAGKDLGVTQSHVSAMLAGLRGPGLNTLILLREKTHMSLDEMLGLEPLASRKGGLSEEDARRVVREELAAHDAQTSSRPSRRKVSGRR